LMSFKSPLLDVISVLIISLGLLVFDIFVLTPDGYEIKLFFTLFSIIGCYFWGTAIQFIITTKEKNKIKNTFSRFVSPAVVAEMLEHPDLVKVGGEKKNVTIFFSDIRNFTGISEGLSPEDLSTILNTYMGTMTNIIFETKGTLDKYIGDAIVAFWGAPIYFPNHAYLALVAAEKMTEALPEINSKFENLGLPKIQHGIGINTGDCNVGNMGSNLIFSYTVIGDVVNLGSRLEQLCKHYGIQLHISEFTKNALSEEEQKEFTFRIIDHMKVIGKDTPVTTYEVLSSSHPFKLDNQALDQYHKAFSFYENKEFDQVVAILSLLHEKYPEDGPTKIMLENAQNFLENPPEDDSELITTHKSKT
jgi:adenylate cyclase